VFALRSRCVRAAIALRLRYDRMRSRYVRAAFALRSRCVRATIYCILVMFPLIFRRSLFDQGLDFILFIPSWLL
jgi:hypothetical protein